MIVLDPTDQANRGALDRLQRDIDADPGAIGTGILLRASRAGLVRLAIGLPGMSAGAWKAQERLAAGRPTVAVIGDDVGDDVGPQGWPAARMMRWCRWLLIHATGAEAWQYDAAIVAARTFRRALVIECNSITLPEWLDLAGRYCAGKPVTLIRPPPGEMHPTPREAGRCWT